jgi:hypothetical protein
MKKTGLGVFAGLLILAAGCEDEDYLDHNPPAGQGSLIVVNNTSDKIDVFLDGVQVMDMGDWTDRTLDTEPGKRRLVVDQDDGSRSESEDVDILEGRLTVVRVTMPSLFSNDYNLDIDYED